jgi:hypothetical protein
MKTDRHRTKCVIKLQRLFRGKSPKSKGKKKPSRERPEGVDCVLGPEKRRHANGEYSVSPLKK